MAGEASVFFTRSETVGTMLCCGCGVSMAPNAANRCLNCLRCEVDITAGLQKHVILTHCPECDSYLQPPQTWLKARQESKELLSICLNMLKKRLNKVVRLVGADFIWTEPHSKRLKVLLNVEKEVLHGGVILHQSYVVEYVVRDQMCGSCSRVQANPDQWVACVQLRQHVGHRRTFFYLEQLILKHDAAAKAIRIKQVANGIDFFFGSHAPADNFVDFIGKFSPISRPKESKQLVSQDTKSNSYLYKHTLSVAISPICREDLICLPRGLALSLGNLGPLVICTKVSNAISLVDPCTLRHCLLGADQYWQTPFKPLLSSRDLVEYIVLDIGSDSSKAASSCVVAGSKYVLAYAHVARVSDFGKNDTIFYVKTHLGHILKPGDYALGYDLYGANCNDVGLDNYEVGCEAIPYAVLVKKSYEEKKRRKKMRPRLWKLKRIEMEVDDSNKKKRGKASARAADDEEENRNCDEYEKFLDDLEENPEMRFDISLYRNKDYQPAASEMMTDGEEEGLPWVPIEELLVDLTLSDGEDGEDEHDSMIE